MNIDQVLMTYDAEYASRYDETFILSESNYFFEKTQFEIGILKALTKESNTWLDVACGTGYFLKYGRGNPNLFCAGLDISPAMLSLAKKRNPNMLFLCGNYLDRYREFEHRWDVVSCMWGAYALQECIGDIEKLVENLAIWTRPGGVCFLPVFDPIQFDRQRRLGVLPEGMEVQEGGTRWTYRERDGKLHTDVLTPTVNTMRKLIEDFFIEHRIFPYPGLKKGVPFWGVIGAKAITK